MNRTEANRIVTWFKKRVGLNDWLIRVSLEPLPDWLPDDVKANPSTTLGFNLTDDDWNDAKIWINLAAHKGDGTDKESPIHTLLHELLHTWLIDRGKEVIEGDDPRGEQMINRLSGIHATLYGVEIGD